MIFYRGHILPFGAHVGDNSTVTTTLSMTGVSGSSDAYSITFAANAASTAASSADAA